MDTWESLTAIYEYESFDIDIVMGRGMSVGWLFENISYLTNFARLILVNDWVKGRSKRTDDKHLVVQINENLQRLLKHERKMTCFLNRNPIYRGFEIKESSYNIPVVRADEKTLETIKRNFSTDRSQLIDPKLLDKVWGTEDHGIMAIMWAASTASRLYITGIDFWETPYWPSDNKYTKGLRRSAASDIGDPRHQPGFQRADPVSKPRGCIDIIVDFMKACDSCEFLIHTLSPMFKTAIEDLSKQVDHVKLI